jgi:hypothetical protein
MLLLLLNRQMLLLLLLLNRQMLLLLLLNRQMLLLLLLLLNHLSFSFSWQAHHLDRLPRRL